MQTINIKDLKYENKLFKTGAEATIYKSNLGLFKEFNITTPEYVRENKRRKLLELVKIDSIKKYYNEIICLVNDTNNEFLTGYVVKKSNGFPLDEIFLLQNEKIIILKKLKNILSTLEKNDVIYEDIHFNNIYYDKATDKLELIDIDNIKIGNYCQDLETFLMEKYYYYGGINRNNGRIFSFNLITYMYLTNHSNYNMNSLLETFDKDIETFTNKNVYLLSKKLLTGEINSECDNEYLIDIIDEKILRK